jgi:hypothetical protein
MRKTPRRLAPYVVTLALLTSAAADARGLYFVILEGARSRTIERAPVLRCPDALLQTQEKLGKVVSCGRWGYGFLASVASHERLRARRLSPTGELVWEHELQGPVVFSGEEVLVLGHEKSLRALWLSPDDGHALREVQFAPVAGGSAGTRRVPWSRDPGCIDQVWYRSTSTPSLQAAMCLVLD